MKRRKLFTIIGSVCLMAVIAALPIMAACAAPEPAPTPTPTPTPTPVPEKVIELKMQNAYPALHPLTPDAFHWWGSEIEKRTNGRVKFNWYDGCTLAKGDDAYEAVRDGIADGGLVDLCREDPLFDISNIGGVPYILQNSWQGSPSLWDLFLWSEDMQKMYSDAGLIPVWQHLTDIFNIHMCDKLLMTPEDAEGLTILSSGTMYIQMVEAIGANPIQVPFEDMYAAAERKMLDGFIMPWAPIRSVNLTDLLPYHTILNIAMSVWGGYMNPEVWATLPPDIQKVFTDIAPSMCALCGATLTNGAQDIIDEMHEKGQTFYEPLGAEREAWVALTGKPIEDDWLSRMEKLGVDGEAHLAKFRELAEKYKDRAYGEDDWWGKAGRPTQ